jgi:hypothetical protein
MNIRTTHYLRPFLVLLALLLLAACRSAPMVNVDRVNIPPMNEKNPQVAMEKITKAIVQAGAGQGWEMRVTRPGQIMGTLRDRDDVAVVDIPYSNTSYSIRYRESSNLLYDPSTKTIHRSYNDWIKELDHAIRAQLSTAAL